MAGSKRRLMTPNESHLNNMRLQSGKTPVMPMVITKPKYEMQSVATQGYGDYDDQRREDMKRLFIRKRKEAKIRLGERRLELKDLLWQEN